MAQPSVIPPHPPPALPPPPRHQLIQTQFQGAGPVHKTLASAANLANLLPTGTVLAFQALTPSFANSGSCQLSNKYLTTALITLCAATCFLSSFTDSFVGGGGEGGNRKLYYGIATFEGLYVFNSSSEDWEGDQELMKEVLVKYRIRVIDFVHAFVSLFVFLMFALSDGDVFDCFFREAGANVSALVINLPLGAGILASFLFLVFPTTRRGIGFADMAPHA